MSQKLRNGLAVTFSISLLLLANAVSSSAQENHKSTNGNFKVVVLEGAPYTRGLTHGRTLKKEINEVVGRWKTHLETKHKMKVAEFIEKFFQKTDFLSAIKRWTPELLEEVRGIADGAEVDFNAMLLFQLLDEEWAHGGEVAGERCSDIGVNRQGTRPAMVAQNMDITGFYNGYQTLLHIKYPNSDLETMVFTVAGLIGLNGVSNKPVGVVVNTLSQLTHSTDGLPVAFVIRGLLEQKSQRDAIKFLHRVKHASGQNYIIGGKEKVYDYEASANKVVRYIPFKNAQVVYHTNHPLANDDYSDKYRRWLTTNDPGKVATGNSGVRFQSLERRMRNNSSALDIDAFQSTLKSRDSDQHPVCKTYQSDDTSFTFGSIVMILSEKPELRLAAGSPDSAEYVAFSFSRNPLNG